MVNDNKEAAQGIHDMFKELISAGFSREEALHMVTAMVVNLLREK